MKTVPQVGIISTAVLPENELEDEFIHERQEFLRRELASKFLGMADTVATRTKIAACVQEHYAAFKLGKKRAEVRKKEAKKISSESWFKS